MEATTDRILIVQGRRDAWRAWCHRLPAMAAVGVVVVVVVQTTHITKLDNIVTALLLGFSFHLLTLEAILLTPEGLTPLRVSSFLPLNTKLNSTLKAAVPYSQVESFLLEQAGTGAAIHVETRDGRELRLGDVWCSVGVDEARETLRQWYRTAIDADDPSA